MFYIALIKAIVYVSLPYIGKFMSGYITDKSKMIYKSIDALNQPCRVINDAAEALKDKKRTIDDSPIQETLAGALGAGTGAGLSFAALYFGGVTGLSAAGITSGLAAAGALVGGGMAAGVAVLAAPVAILGGIAAVWAAKSKAEKLHNAKDILYKDALEKQTAIQNALLEETYADKKRIDYLTSINIALQGVINDLRYDLGEEA